MTLLLTTWPRSERRLDQQTSRAPREVIAVRLRRDPVVAIPTSLSERRCQQRMLRGHGCCGVGRHRRSGFDDDVHFVIDAKGIEKTPSGPNPKITPFEGHLPCNPASGAVDDHKT